MTNEHTARPTTMTDVDTSSKHIAALVAGMRERGMGLHADYIEALAAERDELERLAEALPELVEAVIAAADAMSKEFDGAECEDFGDAEEVAYPSSHITFGIVRNLVKAAAKLKARP